MEKMFIQSPDESLLVETYESKRQSLRYGSLSTMLIIFKSTAGICYFNYHFAIAKVGLYLALFYNIFICYLTAYGIYLVTKIANELDVPTPDPNAGPLETTAQLEAAEKKLVRVYHELPVQLKIPHAKLIQIIILVSCFALGMASNIGNFSIVSKVISTNLGLNLVLVKLLMF